VTAGLSVAELPFIDVTSDEYLRDPHAVYRAFRDRTWIARSERGIELLSYTVSNRLLRDQRFVQPGLYFLEQIGVTDGLFHRIWANIMQHAEDERHARLRRHVMHHFNARAVDTLRPVVRDTVRESLRRVGSGDRFEFVSDVCDPIPSRVFCHLIGSPLEDAPKIASLSDRLLVVFSMNPAYRDQLESAAEELDAYVHDCIRERRAALGEDWISSLIRSQERDPELTDDDIVYLVAEGLIASTDNTSQQLALAMLLLAEDAEQWRMLIEDRSLIRGAIEESMRYMPRVLSVMRIATEDVQLDDVLIPKGSLVSVLVAAAGRDPEVYPDPERFDIRRKTTPGTLNFGAGPHICSGASLARMELQEALAILVAEWDRVEIAGAVEMNTENDAQAVRRLPLAFTPRAEGGVTRTGSPGSADGADDGDMRCPVPH
jgi:cytochrome P450